jgi:hypothetical protein
MCGLLPFKKAAVFFLRTIEIVWAFLLLFSSKSRLLSGAFGEPPHCVLLRLQFGLMLATR